jgi:hypothetical protein
MFPEQHDLISDNIVADSSLYSTLIFTLHPQHPMSNLISCFDGFVHVVHQAKTKSPVQYKQTRYGQGPLLYTILFLGAFLCKSGVTGATLATENIKAYMCVIR